MTTPHLRESREICLVTECDKHAAKTGKKRRENYSFISFKIQIASHPSIELEIFNIQSLPVIL